MENKEFCRSGLRYIWLSATFANGKVWVGSDNQVHDASSYNCLRDRILMLKPENFEILMIRD